MVCFGRLTRGRRSESGRGRKIAHAEGNAAQKAKERSKRLSRKDINCEEGKKMDLMPAQRKWEALPPEKSDVGTVESIYDLFKPNKRPLTYAEYKRTKLSKQPEELEAQTLTALEIMSLSDVTKPEIESAIATLHELGALLSDNGDSRVEVMNAAVELLGDILREAAKTNK